MVNLMAFVLIIGCKQAQISIKALKFLHTYTTVTPPPSNDADPQVTATRRDTDRACR